MDTPKRTMRDAFIEGVYRVMQERSDVFFLSADFGAPALDLIRRDCGERFINVGIAEQNLINVAVGLALEGYVVYAYAIAPFLTMRCYEQVRVNLALMSQVRELNVNLVGVGAGVSYDVSGPTHHCFEDLSIMRVLPNFVVFSPSDYVMAGSFVEYTLNNSGPKYIRLDGKPMPAIYTDSSEFDLNRGFAELRRGEGVCFVTTGYMTHRALRVAERAREEGISAGIVDVFILKPFDADAFCNTVRDYRWLITVEEGFTEKGGLDVLVERSLRRAGVDIGVKSMGFADKYVLSPGEREYLYGLHGFSEDQLADTLRRVYSSL